MTPVELIRVCNHAAWLYEHERDLIVRALSVLAAVEELRETDRDNWKKCLQVRAAEILATEQETT